MSADQSRIVAIVGRPNVGKSAIFNRLARRRIAIVHAESGVTRDRLMREIAWEDERFVLVDTGGICNLDNEVSTDRIEAGVRAQAEAALQDAGAAMLVTDIEVGVHPLDEEVARILHTSGCFTVVAANKADHPDRDDDAAVFERLGLPVFPVSALHNRGFGTMMDALMGALPEAENPTETSPLKVAVVGKPNVGKSSYINRLLRSDRVIVSEVPGTTRDSIDVPFVVGGGEQARHYLLIDTAGIRRSGKIDTAVERFSRMRAEDSISRADVVVHVMDATTGPTAQDRKIAAAVVKAEKGCIVVVNKWDLQESTQRAYGPELQRALPFMGHCPVVFISAMTGYNIRHTVQAIDHVAAQIRAELPTGVLNRAVQDACERVHAPSVKGKALRVYYCTQVGQAPLKIRMFVNNPTLVRPAYTSYLTRSLRSKFGLEGAPVVLQFRRRRRDESLQDRISGQTSSQ